MRSDRHAPVAIVGGGFSGTMVAAQLARRRIASLLIEGGGRAGQGAAYSTADPAHLLNVPAGNMSPWPGSPSDFAELAGDPAAFAQRREFGAYLRGILDEAVASGCVTIIAGRAVGAERSGGRWRVELERGGSLGADALVLATGNQPPGTLRALEAGRGRVIDNPWSEHARTAIGEAVASDAAVLIVGTGLTMVDVVLSLDAGGHSGAIVAVSRRGLAPRGHAPHESAPVDFEDLPAGSTGALLRWLRRRAGRFGWRAAVDALRPHSHALWQSLDTGEKRRFLRHARPWWDVHRHRIAPQVAARLAELIASGQLQILAGRIASCGISDGGADVQIAKRSGGSTGGRFAYVFNCTGPLHDMTATTDPLLKSLMGSGEVRPDELGIGLDVDDRSAVEGVERLWAVGPLTKARFWEIIAVPDIRNQAAQVAEDIARELDR